jgi:hypothetical protein
MTSIFGDLRLDRRFETLVSALSNTPTANLPQALKSWSQSKGAIVSCTIHG